MPAELDSSKNEVEGLGRLNSVSRGSVSLISSAGRPPYPRGGGAQVVGSPCPVSTMPVSLLSPVTLELGHGGSGLLVAISAIDVKWT